MRNLVFTVGTRKIGTAAWDESHQQNMPATILIADDHDSSRAGLEGLLSLEGYQVVTAGDGEMALTEFRRTKPDLLLLDINMPGRSGLDALQDLKRSRPELPVVVLSAFPEKDYAIRAFKLGAAAYVSKQGASSELLASAAARLRSASMSPFGLTPATTARCAPAVCTMRQS